MERLTEKHYLGTDHYIKCSGNCNVDMDCIDCPSFDCLVERLAAYEEMGLEPEEVTALQKDWSDLCTTIGECGGIDRLRELAEADRDGRLVVLPCKVGDTVWMYGEDFGTVLPYTIDLISFVGKGCGYSANYNHNGELIDGIDFEDDDIGKTVFLTREEAEKVLEAMK